jgi:hypothetical protein
VASNFVKGMLAAVSDRKASEHNQKIISNISHQISAQRFFSKQQTDPRALFSLLGRFAVRRRSRRRRRVCVKLHK